MHIVVLENLGVPAKTVEAFAEGLRAAGHTVDCHSERSADPEVLFARSENADAVIVANTPYPDALIRRLPRLKLIDVAFTGIDHVGLEACRAQGITVCNAANYSNQSVAELVIGMVTGLYRKLGAADAAVRCGGTSQGLMGREIAGKTVGIIGTGRIGMMTAKLFLAFGAKVIAYSRSVKPEAEALGIRYCSLEELMAESDIVSVHTPNDASTRGLVSKEAIARMKRDAILINCARGAIVDNAALAEALNEERIAGAGIDVFDMEPPIPADYPLLGAKNTLLAPHVAFLSEEAMVRRAEIVFRNMEAWLAGKPENVCAL
ncbi:MAG: 2-hydroxyacid dehydrogenase [Clostridia bacterium]|nr:2-hydroxyacid dehydrogenase [Clostridia bacterium]